MAESSGSETRQQVRVGQGVDEVDDWERRDIKRWMGKERIGRMDEMDRRAQIDKEEMDIRGREPD